MGNPLQSAQYKHAGSCRRKFTCPRASCSLSCEPVERLRAGDAAADRLGRPPDGAAHPGATADPLLSHGPGPPSTAGRRGHSTLSLTVNIDGHSLGIPCGFKFRDLLILLSLLSPRGTGLRDGGCLSGVSRVREPSCREFTYFTTRVFRW